MLIEGLLDGDLISEASLQRAQLISDRTGQPVEQVLNQIGALSDEDLRSAYARVTKCPEWRPEAAPAVLDARAMGLSVDFLRQRKLLPLAAEDGGLTCAACNPLDEEAVAGLRFATGLEIVTLAASPSDWRRAFAETYPDESLADQTPDERRLEREVDQVSDLGADSGGSRLVASTLETAIALGASDIHFEPRRHDLRIRLRLDGRLTDHLIASADFAAPVISRIKVVANLDLGERRLPQDGRTTFVVEGRNVDVRVSIIPTVFGEAAVMRILDRANVALDLNALGIDGQPGAVLRKASLVSHGMFLVTGPTG
ncbi:MAG TPA: ATPase, T2SS/T4P/T4SS family, partial [Reyranella sp.]|nr:ATPase, T2SS/T4P/T4SS family [Reyranella sp.]